MQKRGLLLKKAIDPTVPRKKVSMIIPNPQQRKESQASPNFTNQAQSQVKLMVKLILFLLATKEFIPKFSAKQQMPNWPV